MANPKSHLCCMVGMNDDECWHSDTFVIIRYVASIVVHVLVTVKYVDTPFVDNQTPKSGLACNAEFFHVAGGYNFTAMSPV